MIDPNNIINFNRTNEELEELILFLICVAGKKASTVSVQLDKFFEERGRLRPFNYIKKLDRLGCLETEIRAKGFGCYSRLRRAFKQLAYSDLNLRTCTKEELMQIHGIGRKSASCFLAWTRKGENVAMLDTHVLAELRDLGYTTPKSTPSSKKEYDRLEAIWLKHCEELNVDPIQYDLQVWVRRSNKLETR